MAVGSPRGLSRITCGLAARGALARIGVGDGLGRAGREQLLDAQLGVLEPSGTEAREANALLEERQRALEWEVAFLERLDDLREARERVLEARLFGGGAFGGSIHV